jgi:hypothetical protein
MAPWNIISKWMTQLMSIKHISTVLILDSAICGLGIYHKLFSTSLTFHVAISAV